MTTLIENPSMTRSLLGWQPGLILNCTWVDYHEAWGPHPGCKEFMTEPEAIFEVKCDHKAAFRVVWTEDLPKILNPFSAEVEFDADLLCHSHLTTWLEDLRDPYSFIVRYRITDLVTGLFNNENLRETS